MAYRIYFDERRQSTQWVLADGNGPLYMRGTVDELIALMPRNETFAMSAEDEARLKPLAGEGV